MTQPSRANPLKTGLLLADVLLATTFSCGMLISFIDQEKNAH
jgi:hypothetical protein